MYRADAAKNNIFLYILDESENVFHCLKPGEINHMKKDFPKSVLITFPNRTYQYSGLCDIFVSQIEADALLTSSINETIDDIAELNEAKESPRDRDDRVLRIAAKLKMDTPELTITEIQKKLLQEERGKSNITMPILRKLISNPNIKKTMKYINE